MAPKRRVSAANVASKRSKLAKELDAVEERDEKLQFQKDLDEHVAELKAEPKKLKRCQAVAKLDAAPKYDSKEQFSPDLEGKTVNKVPMVFLRDEWLPGKVSFTPAEVRGLLKADRLALHKILCRVTYTHLSGPFGPIWKSQWHSDYNARYEFFGNLLSTMKWDRSFNILWQDCGHFELLPKLPELCDDPAKHKYEQIKFLTCAVPLGEKQTIWGNMRLDLNFDHKEAKIVEPGKPWVQIPCWSYFQGNQVYEGVKPIEFKSGNSSEQLALTDEAPALSNKIPSQRVMAIENAKEGVVPQAFPAMASEPSDKDHDVDKIFEEPADLESLAKGHPSKVIALNEATPAATQPSSFKVITPPGVKLRPPQKRPTGDREKALRDKLSGRA